MKKIFMLSAVTAGLFLNGCAPVGGLINATGALISSTGQLLGGGLGTTANTSNGQTQNQQLSGDAILKQYSKYISYPKNNPVAKEQIKEASPTIFRVLQLLACHKNSNSDNYGSMADKYATKDIFRDTWGPLHHMHNHVSGCANIVRVSYDKYEAKNAFSFSAKFESPQSGETRQDTFTMQKQPNGEWLFSQTSLY